MAAHRTEHGDLNVLVVDPDRFARSLAIQTLHAIGLHNVAGLHGGTAAQAWIEKQSADLCLCEATLPDMDSTELIHWIRRHAPERNRNMTVIVMTAQTHRATVDKARDSGAAIVVKKPVSARVLREHIDWAARSERPFIDADSYIGPDRRFRDRPVGHVDRRANATPAIEDGTESIRAEIAAIAEIVTVHGHGPVTAEICAQLMQHGQSLAMLAGRGGYAHLEIVAKGLRDASEALVRQDTHGMAPIAVHLRALQLLVQGKGALTPRSADRVLEGLSHMLAHIGADKRFVTAP